MWCTPEQRSRAARAGGARSNASSPATVFVAVGSSRPPQPEPVAAAPRRRPVRVPPMSPLAFPRLASEDRRARPYTESERRCVAEMMAKLRRGEDSRPEKVERVRDAHLIGEYENEMKFDIALDRLLNELAALE